MSENKIKFAIEIKTEPHKDWMYPYGWGPFDTREEADRARVEADKLWMDARVVRVQIEDKVSS